MIGLRASPEMRRQIEQWATSQPDAPTLSEAIRRLVELGLAKKGPKPGRSPAAHKSAAKATRLAAAEIDRLADASLSDKERRDRKRRILKGPPEFRELRQDQAKSKLRRARSIPAAKLNASK